MNESGIVTAALAASRPTNGTMAYAGGESAILLRTPPLGCVPFGRYDNDVRHYVISLIELYLNTASRRSGDGSRKSRERQIALRSEPVRPMR